MNTTTSGDRVYNGVYTGERLSQVAFPLGGIGAGMICLEGVGALSHVSVRNEPQVFNEPCLFSALCVKGQPNVARVLEGPVPKRKVFGPAGTGNGAGRKTYGLPRFAEASFEARFPFATVALRDDELPVEVEITGWSPFIPGDADSSSLPVAALEYRFRNTSDKPLEAVYSFNSVNFMSTETAGDAVLATEDGLVLWQPGSDDKPWDRGAFCVTAPGKRPAVNCAWFRGGWFDALTMAWHAVEAGEPVEKPPVAEGGPSPGGSLYVPLSLAPGGEQTVRLLLCWHVPGTNLRVGKDPEQGAGCAPGGCGCGQDGAQASTHKPWYAGRFADVEAVATYWGEHYEELLERARAFSDCFYDATLPPEVIEAVAANLTILKSPTVLRQADGRLWCWEGCCDSNGCCSGSCTHVWNYAQALPHLFPELERTLRQTEFNESQDERGHQIFRSNLPIRPGRHEPLAASDGQLGGIIKVHREWRISGDTDWLRQFWPKVKASLDYCSETWDPGRKGVLEEPHHNTYDIEFWGPDGMCTSFYLGALAAAVAMGTALGQDVSAYSDLLAKGVRRLDTELFNGEYFIQKITWKGLRAAAPDEFGALVRGGYSPEAQELLEKEGPKYQYGNGCLSDGVLGAWLAAVSGVAEFADRGKVRSHLRAIHRYNFRESLKDHANPQRPSYAVGDEGGLLLCSWPHGDALSIPFVYSDEVWTGIEYQVASHLMMHGLVAEGLEIVRACRDRYDGRVRNPFNEYECGHWYARAMSSYALLQGLTGARYDAVEKTLHLTPAIAGDFRAFLATATGYGTVGVRDGQPFVEVKSGRIDVDRIEYQPAG